jgi:hypothetical protein
MIADQFIVDTGGKFSIIGVWENLFAPTFPAVHPVMFILTMWKGDPNSSITVETRIWSPNKALLMSTGTGLVRLSPAGKGINVNQVFQTQFPMAGSYRVELLANGTSVHSYDLTIAALPTVQGPAISA